MDKKQQVKKYFDDLSNDYLVNKYLATERSFMSVRLKKIVENINRHCWDRKDKRILDAGCGPGILMSELIRKGFNVVGVDMSHEMLKLADKRLSIMNAERSFHLMRSDIEKMPFEDCLFDMVVTSGVIEYLNSDEKVLKEFQRILRDKGILIISITNKYSYNLILDGIFFDDRFT